MIAGLAAPAGASAALSMKWNRPLHIERPSAGGISAVSCPTATFCAAVDQSGRVLISKAPTKGPKSWKFAKIDKSASLTGISCPTIDFCVAVDNAGNATYSLKPAGGKKQWSKPVLIDPTQAAYGGGVGLAGISCPTTKMCVAVDNATNGSVITTTDPTGSAKSWAVTPLGTGVTLDSVSCATTTFCMAAGNQHYYATSPTGGASAWKPTGYLESTGYSLISSIDCKSATLCLGVGYGNSGTGMATASITPNGAAATWKNTSVSNNPPAAGAGVVDGVSCATLTLCIAVDSSDNVYATTTPSGVIATTTGTSATGTATTASATALRRARATKTPVTKTTATSTSTTTGTTPTTATTPSTTTYTPPPTPWNPPTSLNTKGAGYWSAISCNSKICVVVDGSGFEITGRVV